MLTKEELRLCKGRIIQEGESVKSMLLNGDMCNSPSALTVRLNTIRELLTIIDNRLEI